MQRQQLLEKFKVWIEGEARRLHRPFDGAKWTASVVDVPEQLEECESGVMMLTFIDLIRKFLLVEFDVACVDHLRYSFALEIMSSADK